MKLIWTIVISVSLIIIVSYILSESNEPFGVFGCSPIPFDKALKDIYTPKELGDYLKIQWDPKTSQEKNKMMADWDTMACTKQNELYTMLLTSREKRDTIDKLAK